jgi:hypothetical protein
VVIGSGSDVQEKEKTDERGKAEGRRDGALVPVAPADELEQQQAHAAGEVRGEQEHEAELGRLGERVVGPAQERLEPRLALDRMPERPEVQRQEQRQPETREAMDDEGPEATVRAPAQGRALIEEDARGNRYSPIAARKPAARTSSANAAANASSALPRRRSASATMLRRPIEAWIATALTKTT